MILIIIFCTVKFIPITNVYLPPSISTNSEPAIARKGTLASLANALASSVLPHPGGPSNRAPLGAFPPRFC